MNRAGSKIDKKRRVGIEGFTGANPLDGFSRQILGQMILGVMGHIDWIGIFKQSRFILGGFSRHESIKVVKTHSCWIAVEWSKFGDIGDWRVMPFSKRGGVVAIMGKHLGKGGGRLGDHADVAIPVRSKFGNLAGTHTVMVTSGQQAGAGGGALCRRMKRVVADA